MSKIPITVYSGDIGSYCIFYGSDCDPKHDYHVYVEQEFLTNALRILEEHRELMEKLEMLHSQEDEPTYEI